MSLSFVAGFRPSRPPVSARYGGRGIGSTEQLSVVLVWSLSSALSGGARPCFFVDCVGFVLSASPTLSRGCSFNNVLTFILFCFFSLPFLTAFPSVLSPKIFLPSSFPSTVYSSEVFHLMDLAILGNAVIPFRDRSLALVLAPSRPLCRDGIGGRGIDNYLGVGGANIPLPPLSGCLSWLSICQCWFIVTTCP